MAGRCVRVDPPFVEFRDVKVGDVYKRAVTVTNIGKVSKKICIEKPERKLFKFVELSPAGLVPSGFSVRGVLEFAPDGEEEVRDAIRIRVDDEEVLRVPVAGYTRTCSVIMDSLLDFGCVVARSQVISKLHPLTNEGSEPGVFHVEYSGGNASLSFSPSDGVVAAGATQWLKVELRTDRPGQIDDKALVRLQNGSTAVLSIRAEVVEQQLQVSDPQGSPLSCLWFGPVYFGASCVQNVLLRNNAPLACDWVCVLQENTAGTEVGADLVRSTDSTLLERMRNCSSAGRAALQPLECVPAHGHLGPYDKTTVAVRFSPISRRRRRGSTAGRQDYCLFLRFDILASKHGFTPPDADSSVEVAVTGSGVPVALVPSPSHRFDFPSCTMGQRSDLLCVLRNLCPQLPVRFRFRSVAHFSAEPTAATIGPGQCQDVVLTFNARQQGSFRVRQQVDVLGGAASEKDGSSTQGCCFHTLSLRLSATCCSVTTRPQPQPCPGPQSPTGLRPPVRLSELAHCSALTHAASTKRRRQKSEATEDQGSLAVPKDRALSAAPALTQRQHRTNFTGAPHRSVGTSYAFSEEEEEQRRRHRHSYMDFINQLGQARLEKIRERQQHTEKDDVNIGIVPCQGLVPPELHIRDLGSSENAELKSNDNTTHQTEATNSSSSQISEAVDTVPSTSQQVADCSRSLTPLELYQVVVSPLLVDFGAVCLQSVCVEKLHISNGLPAYIWFELEVDCPELEGSSPLSQVLPPCSLSSLPLTFHSSQSGPFCRSLAYSVNQQHPGQVLVRAQVVPPALELSTNELLLPPSPSMPAGSEYSSSVTLRNPCNCVAEFTWQPVIPDSGLLLFSVRPATGTVDPGRELDCEVVWHPSFSSPSEGDFELFVHEGITQRLHCVAKVAHTTVQLAEKQILFRSVPLNTTSIRAAVLHNSGQNHAYYQVVDECPLPGMVLSPSEGVVPSRGQAMLYIQFSPDFVFKFDAKVEIALRNMKCVQLRVAGSVEPPNVDFSVSHFQFCGVHSGSRQVKAFSITNHAEAVCQVTFDLSQYRDFSVSVCQPTARTAGEAGITEVEVCGGQTQECFLVFSPTQVISYDFALPLTVNGVKWPSSSSSSASSSSSSPPFLTAESRRDFTAPSSCIATEERQPVWIHATALFAPVEMSPTSLQFVVKSQSDKFSQSVELKAACQQSVCWHAVPAEGVPWCFDLRGAGAAAEELCTMAPASGFLRPGQSVCVSVTVSPGAITTGEKVTKLSIPLYLGEKEREELQPYRELSVIIALWLPSITFHPRQILLTPAPLRRRVVTSLTLQAAGYPCGTTILATVDEVEIENGAKIQPVSIIFPDGNIIHPQECDQQGAEVTSLLCKVSFCSDVPVSLCTSIIFSDHMHNRFKIGLCAVADNCLLTVWPYMALHRTGQQIVLKTGATAVEAILQSYHTPSPASGPITSSSFSSFDHNSQTYNNLDSFSYCDSVSEPASKDVCPKRDAAASLCLPKFPAADTEEGLYYQQVALAAERWFSLCGWPGGPHPMSVPHSLRRVVSAIQTGNSTGRSDRGGRNTDARERLCCRSVVDMLRHLTGQQIPGIPLWQTFSSEVQQRTAQLLQQHGAMLAFLRVQGACLCHIRAEYLLDVLEFRHWCSWQDKDAENGLDWSSVDYESLSKRSWTDVLLQTYKVLVLSRVPEKGVTTPVTPADTDQVLLDDSQPLASNVYSQRESHLLSWLNTNYQKARRTVWDRDGVPSSRWIVNFDLDLTDGLVLAAVMAAHCPYLIRSHFQRMYTSPSSLEQILHNNVIVVQALTLLGLNINIKPTDLCNANAVQLLVLCVHLYETLPHYLPSQTLTLTGGLHSTFSTQVRLKNPSSRPLRYKVLLLGEDAHLFSLPAGSMVTIPTKSSAELTVEFSCLFLRPAEAVLLLISSFGFGCRCCTLAFSLKTRVGQITATDTVQCSSPCYQLRVINVPLTNKFKKEAHFRVVLVESAFNPLEAEKREDRLAQQGFLNANKKNPTPDISGGEEADQAEASEFLSTERSVYLKPGQTHALSILYLPFFTGTKYCSVLLLCPQVGDMVYVAKATSEMPLPSPLPARPGYTGGRVLSLRCKVGEVCEEVLQVPLVNVPLEDALAVWAQHCMSARERRRRILTRALHSSTVRAATATHKKLLKPPLLRSISHSEEIEYRVEASLPQYFSLPSTVSLPVREDTSVPWETSAECGCVDMPLRFQAHSVGRFTCKVVLTSCFDIRVYQLEAFVTQQGEPTHLDFTSPVLQSVTQHIPLVNETHQSWDVRALVCGEGFSGPHVVNVAAGTKESYPLTFQPTSQCIVTGRLCLHNDCDGTEHVFLLRGVGEPPLPADGVVISCPVGRTTYTQLNVPNHSQAHLTLRAVTDLPILSGNPSLEIHSGQNSQYTLAVSPWKRGKQTGSVWFIEKGDMGKSDNNKGNPTGNYTVIFSVVVNCEPEAPVKVIDVPCVAKSCVTIEIPVSNPGEELLTLDVCLQGCGLTGADQISLPPRGTLSYKVTYSPVRVEKATGSVVFQSELVGEFWYQLELYALPPSVAVLPQARCHLGKWARMNIPLVNPTTETLKLIVANTNPRNFSLEMDSADTLLLAPQSFTHVGVRFSPSSVGEENHNAKISFACPQLQDCCVLLSGCGLMPETEEPLCLSCPIGSSTSIAVPFTNPTDHQATLSISLTADDPSDSSKCKAITDEKSFSCPLIQAQALPISGRATVDVPVVFTPKSLEMQKAWLCIAMKPISNQDNNSALSPASTRSGEEPFHISWVYPLCGFPLEKSPLVVLQCEVGFQLERSVDVQLPASVPENKELSVQKDFLCEVRSDDESSALADCLSTSIQAVRRDPESGTVRLTLHLLFTPHRICRSSSFLVVRGLPGNIWELPVIVAATKPQGDDVVHVETTEVGRTSAVGFRLTSTTRRPESFKAAFLPGSSTEFSVAPASGMLPPAGTAGALITVSFTPTASCKRHRATLAVQAADMQWIYDVRGETPQDSPLLRKSSTRDSFPAPPASTEHQRHFLVQNPRLPSLANSSSVTVKK
ncbi:cilia- and flagella-associated protein 47 isoform X2 [Fundulus heteroclitus]|uniref:cilia- and flagella-associated protein 47 isoform X2 n=1 Tax=Fundulus heteroclitus TaxID=8078 RepID=UPI00165A3C72|nr:cilia- and flagella-associated protein 47 isoform X2 [Fundulus heteroclitus]